MNLIKILLIIPIFNVSSLFVIGYRYVFFDISIGTDRFLTMVMLTLLSLAGTFMAFVVCEVFDI